MVKWDHWMARFSNGSSIFSPGKCLINPHYSGASTSQIQTKSGSNPRIQPPCLHMLTADFAGDPQPKVTLRSNPFAGARGERRVTQSQSPVASEPLSDMALSQLLGVDQWS